MFNNKYLQVTGTSMGATFFPSIANIYMGWWEAKYLSHDDNPLRASMVWCGRYIDDLLFIVVTDVTAVQQFFVLESESV